MIPITHSLLCRFLALAAALPMMAMFAAPAQAAESVLGHWITQNKKAMIDVVPCGRFVCGKIVKLLPAADPGIYHDIRNSDPKMRTRPLLGLPIFIDFHDDGDSWKGQIYDPQYGNTYRSVISRNPDGTLKVKGCLLFLCKTQTWQPAR